LFSYEADRRGPNVKPKCLNSVEPGAVANLNRCAAVTHAPQLIRRYRPPSSQLELGALAWMKMQNPRSADFILSFRQSTSASQRNAGALHLDPVRTLARARRFEPNGNRRSRARRNLDKHSALFQKCSNEVHRPPPLVAVSKQRGACRLRV
jgi:hypothetical protein